jgi:urea transport system permease protein
MHESAFLLGQVFNGFSVASLFVLAALGLALSFGLMRVINMAHGEMLMLGGYLAYMTLQIVPGPLGILAAMPVAFLGAALLGAVLEWSVIDPATGGAEFVWRDRRGSHGANLVEPYGLDTCRIF